MGLSKMLARVNNVSFKQGFIINGQISKSLMNERVVTDQEYDLYVDSMIDVSMIDLNMMIVEYRGIRYSVFGKIRVKLEIKLDNVSKIISHDVMLVKEFPVPLLLGYDFISKTLNVEPSLEEMRAKYQSVESIWRLVSIRDHIVVKSQLVSSNELKLDGKEKRYLSLREHFEQAMYVVAIDIAASESCIQTVYVIRF